MIIDLEKFTKPISTVLTAVLIACFNIFDVIPGGKVIYLGLSVIVFLVKTQGHFDLEVEPYYIFNILMVVFSAASVIWAMEPYYAKDISERMLITFLCFVFVYLAYKPEKDTTSLMRSFKWGGYIIMLYQIKYYGMSGILAMLTSAERMNNDIGNVNMFGMAMAYGCVIELLEMAEKKKLTFSCPLMIPSLLVISATQSRKAMLIIAFGILMIYLFYFFRLKNIVKSMVITGIFIFICYFLYLFMVNSPIFSGIIKRMEFLINAVTGEGDVGSSAESRQQMIDIGWEQFLKTPILGAGMDNGKVVAYIASRGKFDGYLHNNFIELLCDGGIVGFLIYYSRFVYFGYMLVYYMHSKSKDYYPCLILSVIILLMDYGHVTYYIKSDQIYFVLLFLQVCNLTKNTTAPINDIELTDIRRYRYIR